jgi:mono/diheme cytochrome c family protein
MEEIMKHHTRTRTITGIAAALLLLAVVSAATQYRRAEPLDRKAQLERGKYLVTIGGCHDCHTPWIIQPDGNPGPDMSRALSGHPEQIPIAAPAQVGGDGWLWAGAPSNTAFSGPWGVSFAANLTPDENTGTGVWTFDIFRNTIRNGRHWGVSRPLLPPMPWFNYREMTDEDLEAVFTYIHSLPAVRNNVPEPLPPDAPKVAQVQHPNTNIN